MQIIVRMANSEAVAHTPQPHIGFAYVGITRSISTMYRGAVPITEHQPADVLEPLRGTGWRGHPDPTKALRSGRFALPGAPCHCGAGGMQNRSAVSVILIFVGATAAYLLLCSCESLAQLCPDGSAKICGICVRPVAGWLC